MRKRHQKSSLKIRNGNWIAQWWDEGHRRNKVLGKIRKMTKSEAEDMLADILAPINGDLKLPCSKMSFDSSRGRREMAEALSLVPAVVRRAAEQVVPPQINDDGTTAHTIMPG